MSSIQVRKVNVVPVSKIKIEKLDDDEQLDEVLCKICCKSFVSETAVRNHARMEHIDEFMRGDDLYVTPEKNRISEAQQQDINRSSELVSLMAPTSITSLASQDVSYIIIKDQDVATVQKISKIVKPVKQPKPEKQLVRKEKEVKPITGPFECLQPSPAGPDALCHQIFLSCCEYSTHYRDEHTRRRKGNRCQVCEKHIAGGEQLAPYSCQTCGAGFENSESLSQHGQTAHVKLKPFQCSVCLKRFTQQGGLQQHMRRHTGDRPFACTYCSKAFTQKSGLEQHLRIHTKVKPYRCVVCSKAFCQAVHLQQHMRTHTNVAPFQCGICQKRFKQSSHLNYHLKYHNVVQMTEEQKLTYARLVSQMIKQECADVEIDQSVSSLQEIDQSEVSVESVDQSQQGSDQSEATVLGTDQSEATQEVIDQTDPNEEIVYILDEGVWTDDIVCEQ